MDIVESMNEQINEQEAELKRLKSEVERLTDREMIESGVIAALFSIVRDECDSRVVKYAQRLVNERGTTAERAKDKKLRQQCMELEANHLYRHELSKKTEAVCLWLESVMPEKCTSAFYLEGTRLLDDWRTTLKGSVDA